MIARVLLLLALLTGGAQAQGPILPGPGLPVVAAGPTFTYAGSDDAFSAGSGSNTVFTSTTVNIGAATSDRYVMLAATDQNSHTLTTVTVNGVSLAEQCNDGTSSARIWSGLVGATGGAGAATIVLTYVSAAFDDRIIFVYVGRGMTNTSGAATTATTGGTAPASLNVSVTAGDLLFLTNRFSTTYTGTAPDATPTATNSRVTGGMTSTSPYWNTITSTNASFNVAFGIGANACAATFH